MADQLPDRPEALRVVDTWRGDTSQPIGKNGRLAAPVSAALAADVHAQRDGSALRRQIFQRAPVLAYRGPMCALHLQPHICFIVDPHEALSSAKRRDFLKGYT
jgi:hypothetical protein